MPTYQYACTECGHGFEAVQSFTDDALTVCSECSGRLRKVFSSVGIVFKGSGFYRNDSREAAKSETSNDKVTADKGSDKTSDKGSEKGSDKGTSDSSTGDSGTKVTKTSKTSDSGGSSATKSSASTSSTAGSAA